MPDGFKSDQISIFLLFRISANRFHICHIENVLLIKNSEEIISKNKFEIKFVLIHSFFKLH
jgi:hypothetical protein